MGALALNGVEENVEAGSEDSRDTEHSDSMELESNSLSEEDVDPEYEVFVDRNAVTSASGRYKRESLGEEVEESEQLMDSVEDDDESSSGVVAAYNPSSEEDESEDDPELVAEAKAQELLTRQTLLARRQDAISRFKVEGGWHPDAMNVFERLEMRSYEAIFPWSWKMDFPTLPDLLFSTEGNTFITNNEKNAASGAKALQPLLSLSLTVHEKIEANVPEDRINMFIAREIKHYVTWSERDGGFFGKRFIPALYVHRAKAIDKFDFISKVASEQMMLLAQRHREALGIFEDANGNVHIDPNGRAPPLIYGIIIAQEKVFFMTHDSADPRATVKLLHHFDLSDKDEGVWNGIAIALLVVAARQYNMAIKDELETDDDPLTDVDA
ncbi:hypothetical protein M7I_3344 [Glarea lozoyensis 74030]|nr:hypothetical protein M7I_3344 [Glarea lozoyensis 74030]